VTHPSRTVGNGMILRIFWRDSEVGLIREHVSYCPQPKIYTVELHERPKVWL